MHSHNNVINKHKQMYVCNHVEYRYIFKRAMQEAGLQCYSLMSYYMFPLMVLH